MQLREIVYRRRLTRANITKRLFAILLCIYFLRVLIVASFMMGDWQSGVFWTRGGIPGSLFPVPTEPQGELPVLVEASPLDALIYLLVVQTGLVYLLLVLLIVYGLSPVGIRTSPKPSQGW